jgi:NAD(P)-dependent dehydrogenase (short-subunit alcohol dehydrogenase family)
MALSWLFGAPFNPKTDIPPLEGKVIIVTGGNAGLGKAQLQHLVENGVKAKLYLGARSKAKADEAIKDIEAVSPPGTKVHFLQMDLTDLASVKAAAETIKRENDRLDILVNNAGIMMHPPSLTKDGYEVQFGTNHVGHYLFTRLLLPLLQKTAADPKNDVRILNLSSEGHKAAPSGGFLPDKVKTVMDDYGSLTRYGQSKLANHLFTTELARRYPEVTTVSIHPGAVATNLSHEYQRNHPILASMFAWIIKLVAPGPAKGALNQVWATVANVEGKPGYGSKNERKLVSGLYYVPVAKEGWISGYAKDAGLAKKLWEWSEDEMQTKGFLTAAD